MARDLSLPAPMLAYARVLSAFFQGDFEMLAAAVADVSQVGGELAELARFRLRIYRRDLPDRELHRLADLQMPGPLDGEKYFCLGAAWETLGNEALASQSYARAAASYRAAGCPRKGLRANYNAVVSESRLRPHKGFIAEYQAVIEASRTLGETSFEGMALGMISREYQIAGLYQQALEMADGSLRCLESERGTIHYYHCLLHKAHVLIDLGRTRDIGVILHECEMAPFAPIQAARELLALSLNPGAVWNRDREKDLLPTWRNRIPQLAGQRTAISGSGPMSDLEQTLLRLAYNGPVDKWDLIARLYPAERDSLVVENRFKNLVARVRKKFPGTLDCQDGRYSVAKLPTAVEKV